MVQFFPLQMRIRVPENAATQYFIKIKAILSSVIRIFKLIVM